MRDTVFFPLTVGILVLALSPATASDARRAGANEPPPTRYFNVRSVEIDLVAIATGAAPLRGYQVWFTNDGGKSWEADPEVHRGASPVRFTAAADGTYGFRAVALDAAGRSPAPPQPGDLPEATCVIDTQPPTIDVREPLAGSELYAGTPLILDWQADDTNLGSEPVRIEYRPTLDGPWEVLALAGASAAAGKMQWFTQFVEGVLDVRMIVEDRASNRCEWQIAEPLRIVPFTGFRGSRGIATDLHSAFRRFPVFYRFTKFSSFEVREVEIWYRRDLGEWQRQVDPDRISPYIFTADAEGTYYLYLRAVSHNGEADRPPPGPDTPYDIPVLVDTLPPEGALTVGGGRGREFHRAGEPVQLKWSIDEEHLAPAGCRLEVSLDGGSTWGQLKDGLETRDGCGEFRWRPPLIEVESLAFRLTAWDLARNQTRIASATRLSLINPIVDAVATSAEHHLRALALMERGDRISLQGAIDSIDLATQYNARNAAAWHDRGVANTLLARHETALADYRRALDLVPGDLGFKFSVIQAYMNLYRAGLDTDGTNLAAARTLFDTVSKVEVYESPDFRTALAHYKVLESALGADGEGADQTDAGGGDKTDTGAATSSDDE